MFLLISVQGLPPGLMTFTLHLYPDPELLSATVTLKIVIVLNVLFKKSNKIRLPLSGVLLNPFIQMYEYWFDKDPLGNGQTIVTFSPTVTLYSNEILWSSIG